MTSDRRGWRRRRRGWLARGGTRAWEAGDGGGKGGARATLGSEGGSGDALQGQLHHLLPALPGDPTPSIVRAYRAPAAQEDPTPRRAEDDARGARLGGDPRSAPVANLAMLHDMDYVHIASHASAWDSQRSRGHLRESQ